LGLRGPGGSFRPGVYFGQFGDSVLPFRVDGSGVTMLDEPPLEISRQVIEVGPGTFVRTSHHTVHSSTEFFRIEETEGVVISHRAGRATIQADGIGPDGFPVFSLPDGGVAYTLMDVAHPNAVDFSPDGELLAISERPPSDIVLRTFRAADGTLLRSRPLPGYPFALAFDPERPLLYVGVNGLSDDFGVPTLLVLDRETLETVGTLSAEGSGLACIDDCYKAVIAVSAEPAVYIAASWNFPLLSFRFALPPD